jgi:acyl-CoA thioesterase
VADVDPLTALAPWQEPVRGGHPAPATMARTGLEQLRAMIDGGTPSPPLFHLCGMRLAEVEPGTATFAVPLTGWLRGADGTIPVGPLTIPADSAMACAVIALLGPNTTISTTEMAVRQVRPAEPGTTLLARGTVLEPGPPLALAEVSMTDSAGVLIAHGTSLCMHQPLVGADGPGSGDDPPPFPGPDPWERDPGDSGLAQLTGLSCVSAGHGEAICTMPATRWLCAPPPGRAQGGTVALLAEAAITTAIHSAPGAGRFSALELKINLLRPLATDGRPARAHARVVHCGRRIAVATAEVLDAGGRPIAVASGSAIATGALDHS